MAFAYRGVPFFTIAKPVTFRALRAFARAWIHGPSFFLPAALAFLLTTLPCLFFMRSFACKPPLVFTLLPRSTSTLAMQPLPILLTAFFFIAFMAFIAFIAFAIA